MISQKKLAPKKGKFPPNIKDIHVVSTSHVGGKGNQNNTYTAGAV